MEKALKLLSDDYSLSACIALGQEPPVLGTTSLSLRYFISLVFMFVNLGDAEVAGFVCYCLAAGFLNKSFSYCRVQGREMRCQ